MMMRTRFLCLGAAALLCACGGNQASLDEDTSLQMVTCTLSDGQSLTVQQYAGNTLSGTYTQQVPDCLNDWAVPTA